MVKIMMKVVEREDDYRSFIGKQIKIKVDRPLRSKHPKYGFEYPVNYGFIPGTLAGDEEEIDVYLLGTEEPVSDAEAICIAVIHRFNDNENKLVATPNGEKLSVEEIIRQTSFQEQYFISKVVL